eukprot:scaffold845_cov199-Alexandrium_tamarense.AAC.15
MRRLHLATAGVTSLLLATESQFAPNQVIRGWTEAMQLMKEGAKWELYIPSELGYGDQGAGGVIPGGAVLVFTLELLKVNGDYVKEDLASGEAFGSTVEEGMESDGGRRIVSLLHLVGVSVVAMMI